MSRYLALVVGLCATALFATACQSSGPKRPSGGIPEGDYSYLDQRLTFEAQQYLKDKKIVSVALAVVDGDEVVYSKAFGFADADRASAAETTSFYRQGSITKLLTGIAVMQLVEKGDVELDAPLTTYLPDFKLGPPPQSLLFEEKWSLDDITVRSMLTHHSGIPGDLYKGLFSEKPYRQEDVVRLLDGHHAAAPAGKVYAYSNLAYALLGVLVEKVSGESYRDYVKKNVLAPCGIEDADFERTRPIKARLAQAHLKGKAVDMLDIGNLAAGGLFATLEEMTRFAQMLLAKGEGKKGRVLPAARLEEMWARQNEKVSLDLDHEQGLTFIRQFPPVEGAAFSVGHNGATPYHRSSLAVLPEEGLGVVVLTNAFEGGKAVGELSKLALELALETKKGVEPAGQTQAPQDGQTLDEAARERFVGGWDSALGAMFIDTSGNKLMARVLGQKFELRPTKEGTVRAYLELFGFIPLLLDELQRMELSVESIDGKDVLVATDGEQRNLLGTKLEPRALNEGWKARVGAYEYVGLDEDPLFPKFEVVEQSGFLCFKLSVKDQPGQVLMLAIAPIDEDRAHVAGLGRNRGDQVVFSAQNGAEVLSVYGYTLKKIEGK